MPVACGCDLVFGEIEFDLKFCKLADGRFTLVSAMRGMWKKIGTFAVAEVGRCSPELLPL